MNLQCALLYRYNRFIKTGKAEPKILCLLQEAVQEAIPCQNAQAPPHIRILIRFSSILQGFFLFSFPIFYVLGLVIKGWTLQLKKNAFAIQTGNMLVFLYYQCFLVKGRQIFSFNFLPTFSMFIRSMEIC